jgi:general secretion pathway protein D
MFRKLIHQDSKSLRGLLRRYGHGVLRSGPRDGSSRGRVVLRQGAVMLLVALAVTLAGCADIPKQQDNDTSLQREAVAGTNRPVPLPLPLNTQGTSDQGTAPPPQISNGSGRFVRPTALARPRPAATGPDAVTFNFENQPVQAVVKAILGDMLKENYAITPGVQGNISFSTSAPVSNEEALPILETLLSWTGNALIQRQGHYVVLPAKDAVAGNLVPSLGAMPPLGGLQARLFPLRYISAGEMQKLIKPFTRADAVLLADASRNVLILSGTPDELNNYQRMVNTFDVDWLRGMSVGVFSLQHANVTELMPELDKLFGEKSDTPLAGMLRFVPIQRTNALVVISTQPNYLDEVGAWIAKFDLGGGNVPQLYVYDVRNVKASDLAKYLGQIYTDGNGEGGGGDKGGQVGPGLSSGTLGIGSNSGGSASGMGSNAGSFGSTSGGVGGLSSGSTTGGLGSSGSSGFGGSTGGLGSSGSSGFGSSTSGSLGGSPNGQGDNANHDQQYSSKDGSIRISSVDNNNQLLVRARPVQWEEMQTAIKRLDVPPLQVQIETKIFEVELKGDFEFGVQWYLQGLANSTPNSTTTGGVGSTGATSNYPGAHRQIGLGAGGNAYGGEPFFYSFLSSNGKFQAAIRAIESSTNTKNLSAPSLVVLNNQIAHIQSGDNIPINTTTVNTGIGTNSDYSSATYVQTGVILDVQPRVNPGGLVYLNIHQQVSSPVAGSASTATNGNPQISQRDIATQVGVQSGQTVLLGGLIQQEDETQNNGVPYLTRIPVLGKLFGENTHSRDRTELIVLITPRVIGSSEDAKQITDDYQDKFESLAPLRQKPATTVPPPSPVITTPISH